VQVQCRRVRRAEVGGPPRAAPALRVSCDFRLIGSRRASADQPFGKAGKTGLESGWNPACHFFTGR
jgi:hypothetical protein